MFLDRVDPCRGTPICRANRIAQGEEKLITLRDAALYIGCQKQSTISKNGSTPN
jgi:hypothetical protein